jgi:predicted transcriptional regulator
MELDGFTFQFKPTALSRRNPAHNQIGVSRPSANTSVPFPQKLTCPIVSSACLEDGKAFKSLKRDLRTHKMTAEQYRAKWNLPPDYPMVAPNYAMARSQIAKQMGLGQQPRHRDGS